MRRQILVIALLTATSFASVVSETYRHYLNGSEPITSGMIDEMYEQFVSEFRSGSNAAKFLGDDERKSIFEKKVMNIISHNTNGLNSWKKGINAYSDMTYSEFLQYHHMVRDN